MHPGQFPPPQAAAHLTSIGSFPLPAESWRSSDAAAASVPASSPALRAACHSSSWRCFCGASGMGGQRLPHNQGPTKTDTPLAARPNQLLRCTVTQLKSSGKLHTGANPQQCSMACSLPHLQRGQRVGVQQVALALKQLQARLVQHATQLQAGDGGGQVMCLCAPT